MHMCVRHMPHSDIVLWITFTRWIMYAFNETSLMHYLSSVYSVHTSTCFRLVSSPSSGGKNIYMQQLVCVVRLSWLSTGLDGMVYCHMCTLLPPDDGLLEMWLNKVKINSVSGWFHYTHISRCTVNKIKNELCKIYYWCISWCMWFKPWWHEYYMFCMKCLIPGTHPSPCGRLPLYLWRCIYSPRTHKDGNQCSKSNRL
jgi:hypothetical protein